MDPNQKIKTAWCGYTTSSVVHIAADDETARYPTLCKTGPMARNTTFVERALSEVTCERCMVQLERRERKVLRDARKKVDEAARIERIHALVKSNRERLGPRMTQ